MQKYNNKTTKGSYFRGFDSLSPELGQINWSQITVHDDGLRLGGYGGSRFFGIGGLGSGKTTLNTKNARSSFYIEGMNKDEFFECLLHENCSRNDLKSLKPETNIWRGREFDNWLVLHPPIFKSVYPEELARPLRVHTFKDKNLSFFQDDPITDEVSEIKDIDIRYYTSVKDICENLVMGGHNIIYPPRNHFMSPMLKEAINTKRNTSSERSRRGDYKDRHYLAPDIDYKVERDIFLFEIFEYLYRKNARGTDRSWYNAIIDESHDLFRSNAPDVYFWIIEYMVDVLVDTRKNNISLACMSHALNLIDYRILERASHFGWMRGSKPGAGYSSVDIRLVRKLKPGQVVLESVMDGRIGGIVFERNPDVPQLIVENAALKKTLSASISDSESADIGEDVEDYIGITATPKELEETRPMGAE